MQVLERLYRTKLVLLATVLTVAGIALLVAAAWLSATGSSPWLASWPLTDIGSALFTTGLIVVAFEYIEGRDSELRANERLRQVLKAEAPAIRDAVIDGFAFKREDLARVSTPDTLDQIIGNSLALRLGDETFAREVYDDIRDQAIRAEERWHDAEISIRLDRSPESRQAGAAPLFIVTVRWEYSVVPKHPTRRFVCVSDKDEYRDLAADLAQTSAWYIKPKPAIDAGSRDAFELVQFTVDGQERPIRRSVRKAQQTYTVSMGAQKLREAKPIRVSYTYRTITEQAGNMLHFDIEQPTRGVSVQLDYGDTDITHVSVLDFFASSRQARILRTPTTIPGKSVSVEFDAWVFPRSGVAFVWTLPAQTPQPLGRPLPTTAQS